MAKHILILTTTNDFLGKFELDNVRLLQQMGYVVHYAANMQEPHYISDEERIRALGVLTHHIPIARSPFLLRDNQQALHRLLDIIREHRIRAIHCHTPVGGVLGRLAGRLFRDWPLLVLYTAHGFHFYKGAPRLNRLVYYRVERQLARYTDILIVINEEDYRSARHFRLKKGGRLYKIPGVGLDEQRFRPLEGERRRILRQELGIGEGDFFLVSVGELNDNKNQRVVLEALVRLRELGRELRGIRYGICGDGFFRSRLEGWIKELGLEDCVTLYGHCDNVPEILGCADAAVFPSKREGLGMAGLEALAMGIPLLAADNRGTREYMEHGRNGLVYPPDDPMGFAQGIQLLRHMRPGRRERMAAYCRESVKPFSREYAQAVMRRIYAAMDERLEENGRNEGKEDAGQRDYGGVQARL